MPSLSSSFESYRLLGYLAGRQSGQYMFSHPFWDKRDRKKHHDFGSMTVADVVGDTFQPQQVPLRIPQYYTGPIYQPTGTWDNVCI
jgi:hypothetical protein